MKEKPCNLARLHPWLRLAFFAYTPHGRFLYIFRGGEHELAAVSQTVYFFGFGKLPFVPVNGLINAAQHGLQRNTGIFPRLNQGPVERGKQESGAAPALVALFDLRKVVEIVVHKEFGRSRCNYSHMSRATPERRGAILA